VSRITPTIPRRIRRGQIAGRAGRPGARDRRARFGDPALRDAGNLSHARDLVDEVLRLRPNSVRHRRSGGVRVQAGDKAKLNRRLPRAGRRVAAVRSAREGPPAVYGGSRARCRRTSAPARSRCSHPRWRHRRPRGSAGKVKAKTSKDEIRNEAGGDGDSSTSVDASDDDEGLPAKDHADRRRTRSDRTRSRDFQTMLAGSSRGRREHRQAISSRTTISASRSKGDGPADERSPSCRRRCALPREAAHSEMLGICFSKRARSASPSRFCAGASILPPPGTRATCWLHAISPWRALHALLGIEEPNVDARTRPR